MASEIRVNKIANRAGLSTVEYTDTGIIVSGIVTCTEISGLNALNIAGVSTFASPLDINGDIDVDGHTNLDNLSVAGVSTFSGEICLDTHPTRIKSSAGDLEIGVGTTSSFFITGGPYSAERLETTVDCVILYSAGSKVARTHNGRFEVGNPAAATGIGATLSITGGANFAGIVTASSFSGDGSDLTGIDATKIITGNTQVQTIDTGSDGHIKFTTEGSERARIIANGNIGIGEDAPVAKVHIAGSNYASVGGGGFDSGVVLAITRNNTLSQTAGLALNSGTNGASFIHLGDADDPDIGKITYDHVANSMKFAANTTERLEINNTGVNITGIVTATSFSGDGSSLSNLPAGAPVGGASTNTVFFENDKAVGVGYSITSGKNAMSAGPITINAGIAVTVPSGSSWTIV